MVSQRPDRQFSWSIVVAIGLMGAAFGLQSFAGDAEGSGDEPSRVQIHAAFAKCAEQLGIKPSGEGSERPTPPSPEQREKMHACLKAAGVNPPDHGMRRRPASENPRSDNSQD